MVFQLSTLCRESYGRTLAKYHSFIIRNAVALASFTLGSREAFIKNLASQSNVVNPSEEQIIETIDRLISASKIVYQRVQVIYSDNQLLDLP